MALEGTRSVILQQLGVSYPQLVDYYSKQDSATLVQIGTLVLLTWDFIITFDDEIAHFWQAERRARWSVARVLFMLNRHLPIIAFSLHVYWRVNRSLDNPISNPCHSRKSRCTIKGAISYSMIPVYITIEILQVLRVWSLYNRSRYVSLFLLALVICENAVSTLRRTLPALEGLPPPQLAPDSLTGCGHEWAKGFLDCIPALVVQTILSAMITLKAIFLDGAIFYGVFTLAFVFEVLATTSDELYYPIVDTNAIFCVNVIACNHLMLYLREAASRPTSLGPVSSLSRPTIDALSTNQTSDSYNYKSKTVPRPKHDVLANWNHAQDNSGRKPHTWYKMQHPSSSIV